MTKLLEVEEVRVRFRNKGAVKALLDREGDPFIDAVCRDQAPAPANDAPGHHFTCHFPRQRVVEAVGRP